jgi:hypothetical protein
VPLSGFHINKSIQKALEMELHKAFKSIPGAEVVKELIANATKIVKELEVSICVSRTLSEVPKDERRDSSE